MNNAIKNCVDRNGIPKKTYHSMLEAREVAAHQSQGGMQITPYQCDECQKFHLTKGYKEGQSKNRY